MNSRTSTNGRSHHDTNNDAPASSLCDLCLAFGAGLATASAVAWYRHHRAVTAAGGVVVREWNEDPSKEREEKKNEKRASDAKNFVGELPTRRRFKTRWPWDRSHSECSESGSRPTTSSTKSESIERSTTDASNNGETNTSNPNVAPQSSDIPQVRPVRSSSSSSMEEKSALCIGRIFGLDVGGTLAKLAYFERKPASSERDRAAGGTKASSKAALRRMSHQQATSGKEELPQLHRTPHSGSSGDLGRLRQESVPYDLQAFGEASSSSLSATESEHSRIPPSSTSVSPTPLEIRRTRSLMDLQEQQSQQQHAAQALDRFYKFARGLDSYRDGVRDHDLSFYSHSLGGEFHFLRFETRRMPAAMELVRHNKLHLNIHEMGGTGGGAHKFAPLWKRDLGIGMRKQDELDCLVVGMQFVLSTVDGECYTFRPRNGMEAAPRKTTPDRSVGLDMDQDHSSHSSVADEQNEGDRGQGDEWWWSRKVKRDSISYSSTFPYLVVTIGTGVSVLRVDGPGKYERVSGSTIGGGTYLGLIRLLTDMEDFDDVMRLADRGDPSKVDMLVGDIYGENSDALEKIGLPSNLVASSFGKLVAKEDPAAGLKQEDLARALLMMITNNIGQVAYLNAKLFNTPRIYFVGNFLRQNKISQSRLSYAINYWSKGEMEALFLEHEGYFGALGAFLLTQDIPFSSSHHSQDPR